MKGDTTNLEKNTTTSLRERITKVVHEYCDDVECEIEDCRNPNCEAYAYACLDAEELVEEIMKVIENEA